jgi:hypothetical protein
LPASSFPGLLTWLGTQSSVILFPSCPTSFLIACDAEPYAYSPYLSVLRTIIRCILMRFCLPAPHLVGRRHLIRFIFFICFICAHFFYLLYLCSFLVILESKINPRMQCGLTCSIRSLFIHMLIVGLFTDW